MASTPAMAAVFAPHPSPLPALVWVPCASCWGQRRQFVQDARGRWWGRDCPRCEGSGEVLEDAR